MRVSSLFTPNPQIFTPTPPAMRTEPLTDARIKAAKPQDKQYKLTDSHGLYLVVYPTGGKAFRLKYRYAGVEKTLSIGKYPLISLKQARLIASEARKDLALGVDPGNKKQATKQATIKAREAELEKATSTLEAITKEWFTTKTDWKPSHGSRP